MEIGIVAKRPEYAAASMLAEAIREHTEHKVTETYYNKSMYGVPINDATYGLSEVEAEHVIFAGSNALHEYRKILPLKAFRSITVLLTDSFYLMNYRKCNTVFDECDVRVFALPWITRLSGGTPYYHPIRLPNGVHGNSEKRPGVWHSPGNKLDRDLKGTRLIAQVCRELGVPLYIISNKTWEEGVRAKAAAGIFVDQVISENPERFGNSGFHGEMGKSGIEAMKLGAVVMTSGEPTCPSPVVYTSPETLKDDLAELLRVAGKVESIRRAQSEWVKKYLDPSRIAHQIVEGLP